MPTIPLGKTSYEGKIKENSYSKLKLFLGNIDKTKWELKESERDKIVNVRVEWFFFFPSILSLFVMLELAVSSISLKINGKSL